MTRNIRKVVPTAIHPQRIYSITLFINLITDHVWVPIHTKTTTITIMNMTTLIWSIVNIHWMVSSEIFTFALFCVKEETNSNVLSTSFCVYITKLKLCNVITMVVENT